MPTDRVHRLPQQAQPRAIRPHRPQPPTSDAATQLRHARPAPNERRCTRYVALHPLRRNAPDQKGCNAYRSGAPPPTTSQTAGISSRHTQAAASDAATQPRNTRPAPNERHYTRYVAMHPLRRDTPVTSQCTRSEGVQCLRIGCTASSTSSLRAGCLADTAHAGIQQAQAAQCCTRYDSNAVQRRLKRRLTTEKHTPATTPLTAADASWRDALLRGSATPTAEGAELTFLSSSTTGLPWLSASPRVSP